MKIALKGFLILLIPILSTSCDAKDNKVLSEIEHPKLVHQITSLLPESQKLLENTSDTNKKIAILKEDLIADEHYKFLGAYNSPEFTTDFISEIEAGKMMLSLSRENPGAKTAVVRELKNLLFEKDLTYLDQKRGTAIYFLGQILGPQEETLLKEEIGEKIQIETAPEGFAPSYTEYYLEQI